MEIVYAKQPFPDTVRKSVFLAGPTPRHPDVPSWRDVVLKHLGFSLFGLGGTVFVPEPEDGQWDPAGYESQVEWEDAALNRADCIVFWVPRDMETMPALTTNVEFGFWANSGKVIFGYPKDAPDARRNKYLEHHAKKLNIPVVHTIEDLVREVDKRLPKDFSRSGGEAQVPLHIWQSESFQGWYRGQKAVGNTLNSAKVVWTFFSSKVVPVRPIFWALHVNVHIKAENRDKTNEALVLSRMDISSVVLYRRDEADPENSDIVLVREFRSPVRNSAGFVYEAPGGSSFKPGEDPYTVAAHEVEEETGLKIDPDRVRALESRQLLSTMSAHKSHLFAVELMEEEVQFFRDHAGEVHGVEEDSERTYVEVLKLRDLYTSNVVDWSMMGMIHRVLFGPKYIPAP